MAYIFRVITVGSIIWTVVCFSACQKQQDRKEPQAITNTAAPASRKNVPEKQTESTTKESKVAKQVKRTRDNADEQALLAVVPKVSLSDAIRATCLVGVGDVFPDGVFSDIAGRRQELKKLLGKGLTVVCCWNAGTSTRSRLTAIATLQDLNHAIVEQYADKGVSVVGINVGNSPAEVTEVLKQAEVGFPVLLDPQGDFFAKLARDRRMPRVFLLDNNGKILWFDVEFSRSSRQDLLQGIDVALGKL